jgi:hypothetical protein
VEVGAVLAVVAGGLGTAAAATIWLREEHPTAPPVVPAVGAGLLLLGYLLPIVASGFPNGAYADSLNVREPWEAVFWLLAPAFGLALVARGRSPTTFLAGFALAIFVGGGAAVVHHVWTMRPFDELVLGPHVYFGGLVLSAASAIGHVQRRQLAAIVLPFLVGAVVSGVAVVLSDAPWEWTVAALAGATAVVFVLARRGRAGRPAAGERSEPAPAPGSPPPGRSAPGSGGSPPAAP